MKNYKSLAWTALFLMIVIISVFFTNQPKDNHNLETNIDNKGVKNVSSFIVSSTFRTL